MYQPLIRDELIRKLYRVSRAHEMPMTKMLNTILERALEELEGKEDEHTVVMPSKSPEPETSDEQRLNASSST
jgi:hypothetical protein